MRSVDKGASHGGFAVYLELEVEVFHERGGVVGGGCAIESLFVDYGDAAAVSVGSVPVRDFVSSVGGCGDVQTQGSARSL